MVGTPLRVLAAIVLTGSLVAAPVVALRQRAPTPVSAAAVSRTLSALAAGVRLDPDALRARPEPTPTPTPVPTPAPTRSQAAQALRPAPARSVPPPSITAPAGLLLDADTGRVLWSRNSGEARPAASVAKIFTAMVAVSQLQLDRQITVPASITALPWDSTLMGLTPGETLSVRELLDGALLVSGNDAALTLSGGSGSEPAFVASMNALAARIGLRQTHFTNPVGLDDPGQYSSAMDLARAALYLDRNYPLLARIAASPQIDLPGTTTHKAFRLVNLDRLLWTYPGVNGLKGGYTGLAGGCVLTTATLHGHHLVAIVLGSPPPPAPGAFADMKALLDYASALYS
ncbi:MAG: D-alanyl-D-alanine carboxypeptidase [Chloroflexi bacterium]|nr:MAG: D-alanyl-D-alanine carboxypeptidase [Chloroflexota bacterium]